VAGTPAHAPPVALPPASRLRSSGCSSPVCRPASSDKSSVCSDGSTTGTLSSQDSWRGGVPENPSEYGLPYNFGPQHPLMFQLQEHTGALRTQCLHLPPPFSVSGNTPACLCIRNSGFHLPLNSAPDALLLHGCLQASCCPHRTLCRRHPSIASRQQQSGRAAAAASVLRRHRRGLLAALSTEQLRLQEAAPAWRQYRPLLGAPCRCTSAAAAAAAAAARAGLRARLGRQSSTQCL
jgi:hypothetical protein